MTKLLNAVVLALVVLSAQQAHAKSALFTLSNDWIPCGKPPYGDDVYWWQKPWEQEQIIIYSASLDLILNKAGGGDLMVGGMIGNSTEPDPVTSLKMAAGQGPMLTLHNEMPANAVPMRYGALATLTRISMSTSLSARRARRSKATSGSAMSLRRRQAIERSAPRHCLLGG